MYLVNWLAGQSSVKIITRHCSICTAVKIVEIMVFSVPNIGTYVPDNTMSYTRVLTSTTTRNSYLTEKICILCVLFNLFLHLFLFTTDETDSFKW